MDRSDYWIGRIALRQSRAPVAPEARTVYGKQTECAIAAMSRLAEVYDGGRTLLSAGEIADHRELNRPIVAKILSVLSQAGLVTGARGPTGGFTLARPPHEITIYEVFRIFEREDPSDQCPFGGGICGVGEPCPIHHKLAAVQTAVEHVLYDTTFEVFTKQHAGQVDRSEPGD